MIRRTLLPLAALFVLSLSAASLAHAQVYAPDGARVMSSVAGGGARPQDPPAFADSIPGFRPVTSWRIVYGQGPTGPAGAPGWQSQFSPPSQVCPPPGRPGAAAPPAGFQGGTCPPDFRRYGKPRH